VAVSLGVAQGATLEASALQKLAQEPIWLKLLHADNELRNSKIISDRFFLSAQGKASPAAELEATLQAFSLPWNAEQQTHAVCRFPARYLWLSHSIDLPEAKAALSRCRNLNSWANQHSGVSLILVSGYLGNPASTFGHSLLKLSVKGSVIDNDLFDSAVNYGALVPKDESTLRYVFKGIFGGYEASFSDKYYYTQDLVYSKLESRDMWEYELNLSSEQRQLLIYHLWEILGQKFDYFFLNENCAYQLSDVLQLVIDEPLLKSSYAWYLPVEAFQKLQAIDESRVKRGLATIVGKVVFLPSSQRKLNYQINKLEPKEKEAAQALVENPHTALPGLLQPFSPEGQSKVLDASLAYYNYRLVKEGLQPSEVTKDLKQQLLVARFKLPAQKKRTPPMPDLPSPAQSNKATMLTLGAGYHGVEGGYSRLHWAGYHQNTTGKNTLAGDELVLLDTAIGFHGEKRDVFVDAVDFIRMRKFNQSELMISDSPWSWQMRIGASLETKRAKQDSSYDGQVSFGVGKAWRLGESSKFYAMTDMAVHTMSPYVRLRPHLGLYADMDALKMIWFVGAENVAQAQKLEPVWGGELEYQLGEQRAIFMKFEDRNTRRGSAEMRWFW